MADPLNLFSGLGIDTRSQEQILADNKLLRRQELLEMQQGRSQTERNMGALRASGAQIGDAFGNKLGAPGMNEVQQKDVVRNNRVQERMRKMKSEGAFMKGEVYDSLLEGETFQRIMAEELLADNDPRGIALLQQLDQTHRARKQQDIEIDRLNAGIDSTRQSIEESRVRADNGRIQGMRNRVMTYWMRGETDPNMSFQGRMTEDGQGVVGPNGDIIPFEEVTAYAPVDPTKTRGRILTANDYGVSDSEAKGFRDNIGAISDQMRSAIRLKRALADAVGEDGSLNIMDGSGKVTTAVTTGIDFLKGVANTVELSLRKAGEDTSAGIMDGDYAGKNLGDAGISRQYVRDNLEELEQKLGDLVPPYLRNAAIQRQEYYAALVQMVYQRARTNEPGARQLSDADFKNAMIGLAGSTSDPEAFRQVMMGNIMNDWSSFNDRYLALPDEVRQGGMVLSAASIRNYQDAYRDFIKEFGVGSFGSPEQVSDEFLKAQGQQDRAIADEAARLGVDAEPVGAGTADDPIILQ